MGNKVDVIINVFWETISNINYIKNINETFLRFY